PAGRRRPNRVPGTAEGRRGQGPARTGNAPGSGPALDRNSAGDAARARGARDSAAGKPAGLLVTVPARLCQAPRPLVWEPFLLASPGPRQAARGGLPSFGAMLCLFMNSEQAFRKAILADPDDDMPRLVYADWLEEHGDPRGELIR